MQIPCFMPAHGPDNRPSARYYGANSKPHFFCFKCKRQIKDSVNLFAELKGLRFMDALSQLERRFNLKIPQRPDGNSIIEPIDRDSNYVSTQWQDIPRMLGILEGKLARIKPKCGLVDYLKFCRVLDAVQWDFDKTKKADLAMLEVLKKLMNRMDEINSLSEFEL
jgi:hypothetical protein